VKALVDWKVFNIDLRCLSCVSWLKLAVLSKGLIKTWRPLQMTKSSLAMRGRRDLLPFPLPTAQGPALWRGLAPALKTGFETVLCPSTWGKPQGCAREEDE